MPVWLVSTIVSCFTLELFEGFGLHLFSENICSATTVHMATKLTIENSSSPVTAAAVCCASPGNPLAKRGISPGTLGGGGWLSSGPPITAAMAKDSWYSC